MSYYIHHVPGRLRVRADSLKGSSCDAEDLCAVLERLPGVRDHRLNPKTGSLLVHYDAESLQADDILYQMVKAGCLESGIAAAAEQRSRGPVTSVGSMVGSALFGTFVKKSLETSITSFARSIR
jgi:hypothetical protein